MAKKEKKKKKSVFKNPIVAIKDNIVFSDKSAWAYYVLAEKPYNFLSMDAKINLANLTMQGLSSLCRKSNESVECHLLITTKPFNTSLWEEQMWRVYKDWDNKLHSLSKEVLLKLGDFSNSQDIDPLKNFIRRTVEDLKEESYTKRVTLLGIKLYNRGSLDIGLNPLEVGWEIAKKNFKEAVSAAFLLPNDSIGKNEEKKAVKMEKDLYQIISTGGLSGKRATAEELLLTIKSRYYPSMPYPYLDVDVEERVDVYDIEREIGGELYHKPTHLHLKQFIDGQEYDGYRTTLTVSSLPKDLIIPTDIQGIFSKSTVLPFTCNARFVLTPTEKMKNELNKKKLEADDEIKNLSDSGQRVNAYLVETMSNIEILEEELNEDNLPWLIGSYRITLYAYSQEVLNELIALIQQEFAKDDTTLTLTHGDQLDLFREEIPGAETYIKDFQLTTNLALIPSTGLNHGGEVGDEITENNKRG